MLATNLQLMHGQRSTERCLNHALALLAVAFSPGCHPGFMSCACIVQLRPSPSTSTALHTVADTLLLLLLLPSPLLLSFLQASSTHLQGVRHSAVCAARCCACCTEGTAQHQRI
jgi:hypothetical protein